MLKGSVHRLPCRNPFPIRSMLRLAFYGEFLLLANIASAIDQLGYLQVTGNRNSRPKGGATCSYSNPFAFKTVWAAGEVRNMTNILAASVWLLPVTMPGAN